MREFLRRGGQDQRGLDDLARRVAERRRELLQRHNLDGTLAGGPRAARPRGARGAQAAGPRRRRWTTATGRSARCSSTTCRPRTAAAVSELSSYDWQSREAREDYEQIKDLLGRELLDQRFAGMKQALENATDEDRAAINEMLADLNELLEKHAARRGHRRRTSTSSWTSTATSSRRTRRTSTSCSTRSPSAPRPPSGCSTR